MTRAAPDLSGFISLKEYDPKSAELLESFKVWAEMNYGSIKHCFEAIDGDNSGQVTLAELKRACHKGKWHGEARLLFDCIDLDQKRSSRQGDKGRRTLSLNEISFLDQWQLEPTEEELAYEEEAIAKVTDELPKHVTIALSPPRRSPSKARVKELPNHSVNRCFSAPDLALLTQMGRQSKPQSRPQSRQSLPQSRPQSRQFNAAIPLKGTLESMPALGPDDLPSAQVEFMTSTWPQFSRSDAGMDKQVRPQNQASSQKVSKIRLRCEGNKVLASPDATLVQLL